MKTQPLKTTTIKCEEQQNYLSSFWSRLLRLQSLLIVRVKNFHRLHALPAIQAGQVAGVEILQSKRFMCGIVLILLAPLTLVSYLLFDPAIDDRSWYYTNMFWYMHTVAPYLCLMLWSIGAFLLFPTKSSFRYIAMLPSTCLAVSMFIHLTFFAHDYQSFNSPLWVAFLSGSMVAIALLIAVDFLVYRKYHTKDGNLKRVFGIILAPGIDADKKVTILKSLIEESENFYARV